MKTQVVVNKADKEIICVSESFGKIHDFKIYKGTIGKHILSKIKIQADSGYQGMTIGKILILSPSFSPSHTVRDSFPSHGVPSENRIISFT